MFAIRLSEQFAKATVGFTGGRGELGAAVGTNNHRQQAGLFPSHAPPETPYILAELSPHVPLIDQTWVILKEFRISDELSSQHTHPLQQAVARGVCDNWPIPQGHGLCNV